MDNPDYFDCRDAVSEEAYGSKSYSKESTNGYSHESLEMPTKELTPESFKSDEDILSTKLFLTPNSFHTEDIIEKCEVKSLDFKPDIKQKNNGEMIAFKDENFKENNLTHSESEDDSDNEEDENEAEEEDDAEDENEVEQNDDDDDVIVEEENQTVAENRVACDLPPLGIFWDIENIAVPKDLSALEVVEAFRKKFFKAHWEAEFAVVCNTFLTGRKILYDLNQAQVNVLHTTYGQTIKNATDHKLIQLMRRFARIHGEGSSIVLISSDFDFTSELLRLRRTFGVHVTIVLCDVSSKLKVCADEIFLFDDVIKFVHKGWFNGFLLFEHNIPKNDKIERHRIKSLLFNISLHLGLQRVTFVGSSVKLIFKTPKLAAEAEKQIKDTNDILIVSPLNKQFAYNNKRLITEDPFHKERLSKMELSNGVWANRKIGCESPSALWRCGSQAGNQKERKNQRTNEPQCNMFQPQMEMNWSKPAGDKRRTRNDYSIDCSMKLLSMTDKSQVGRWNC